MHMLFEFARGRLFLVIGYGGCATGWGHIFTTGLTIKGSPFEVFSMVNRNGVILLRVRRLVPKSD